MAVNYRQELNWFKVWWLSFRPFSFSASIIPIVLGFVVGLQFGGRPLDLRGLTLTLIGGLAIHVIANLTNSYYDWIHGFDQPEDPQAIAAILHPELGPQAVMAMIRRIFISVALMTVVFGMIYGWAMTIWPILGLLGGYYYTAPPVAYKYRGLSLPAVLSFMGLFMPIAAYQVQTGRIDGVMFMFAIPIASLVTAILQANELRDFAVDKGTNRQTLTTIVGRTWGRVIYLVLIFSPYIWVAMLSVFGLAPRSIFVSLLTLPISFRLAQRAIVYKFSQLDVDTAKLHAAFGLVYIGSMFITI